MIGVLSAWHSVQPSLPPSLSMCAVWLNNGVVSYITEIPTGTEGTLYSSVEIYPGTGANLGASGTVVADPANMPDVDPASLAC